VLTACSGPSQRLFRPVPVLTPENTPIFSAVAHTETGERALIFGLWQDGLLIWSEDSIHGGAPYQQRQLDRDHFAGVVHRFWTLFGRMDEEYQSFVRDDAPFIELRAEGARRRKRLDSWHETFEANTNLVVTAQAVEALAGRTRREVLAQEDQEYRRFRMIWTDLRLFVQGLTRQPGDVIDPEELGRYLPERFVFESGAQ